MKPCLILVVHIWNKANYRQLFFEESIKLFSNIYVNSLEINTNSWKNLLPYDKINRIIFYKNFHARLDKILTPVEKKRKLSIE